MILKWYDDICGASIHLIQKENGVTRIVVEDATYSGKSGGDENKNFRLYLAALSSFAEAAFLGQSRIF